MYDLDVQAYAFILNLRLQLQFIRSFQFSAIHITESYILNRRTKNPAPSPKATTMVDKSTIFFAWNGSQMFEELKVK